MSKADELCQGTFLAVAGVPPVSLRVQTSVRARGRVAAMGLALLLSSVAVQINRRKQAVNPMSLVGATVDSQHCWSFWR